jgi:hypothetical protein
LIKLSGEMFPFPVFHNENRDGASEARGLPHDV